MPKDLPIKNKYIQISETARVLGVSIDTLRRWDKSGKLKSFRIDSNKRYFNLDDINYIKNQDTLSISQAAAKIGVSLSTMRRLEKKGYLMGDRNSHNERVFTPSQIDELIYKKDNGILDTLSTDVSLNSKANAFTEQNAPVEKVPQNVPDKNSVPLIESLPNSWDSFAKKPSVKTDETDNAKTITFPKKSFLKGSLQPALLLPVETFYSLIKNLLKMLSSVIFSYKRSFVFLTLIGLIPISIYALSLSKSIISAQSKLPKIEQQFNSKGEVLAESTRKLLGNITFNIPAVFNENLFVEKLATFSAGINVTNGNVDVGDGSVFGSNLIYGITSGTGLSVTGDQNVTLTNTDPGSSQNIFKNIKVGTTTFSAGSNTDTIELAGSGGVSVTTDTTNKKLTFSGSGGFSSFTLSGSSGTSQTISDGNTLTIAAGNGTTTTASSTDTLTVGLDVATTSTTTTTSSNSGLEVTASGLRLLGGCDSSNNILKWVSGTSTWDCGADDGGPAAFTSAGGIIDKTTAADRLRLLYGDAGDVQFTIENTTNNVIPTVDSAVIDLNGNTTGIVTDGVDALYITAEFGNGTTNTNSGIHLDLDGVNTPSGDEVFNGILIDAITATSATERAISIGNGWDANMFFNDLTTQIQIADTGVFTFEDTSGNDLATITDSGTTGTISTSALTLTANIALSFDDGSNNTFAIRIDTGDTMTFDDAGVYDFMNTLSTSYFRLSDPLGALLVSAVARVFPVIPIMDGSDTARGFMVDITNANHSGVGNTLYGIDIDSITGDADANEIGLNIGSGWDANILFNDTTTQIQIADTGVFTWEDSAGNDLATLTDNSNAGDLVLSGDLTVTGGDIVGAATTNLLNAATTVNLGSTAVTRTINIGTGTNVDTINIGTGGTNADAITIGVTGVNAADGSALNLPGGYLASGAVTGKALAILNESGDQNILVASSSGSTNFQIGRIPSAGASGNILNLNPTLTAMNGSDTVRGLFVDLTNANHTSTSNTLYGIDVDSITADADATEAGIHVGTGWDYAGHFDGDVLLGKQTDSVGAFSRISQSTAGTIASGGNAGINIVYSSASYNGSLYVGTAETNAAEVYRYDGGTTWTVVNGGCASCGVGDFTVSTDNMDEIVSMAVYNGYLYVGTFDDGRAAVYRYDGTTSWTLVSSALGTIDSGGTTLINGAQSMAVYNGQLYLGTYEANAAEVYRYEGGTNWTLVSGGPGAGDFAATTDDTDGVLSMAVYNGSLYIGVGDGTDEAQVLRYDGGTTWVRVNNAEGTIAASGTANILTVWALTVHNGALYAGTKKADAAQVYRYDTTTGTSGTNWTLVSTTGTLCGGGVGTERDKIGSLISYNGYLYAGTVEADLGEVCRYDGSIGTNSSTTWTLVSSAAGTISSGASGSQDEVQTMVVHNGTLYAGVGDDDLIDNTAEVHAYTNIEGQSYALKFNAASDNANAEQNSFLNLGSISFLGESWGTNSYESPNSGAFLFSHSISTSTGAYDIAEDYPTRNDTLEAGEIVSTDLYERGFVKRTDRSYDQTLLGVYSEQPGLRLSQKGNEIDGGRAIPIALAGRVGVKVASGSANIKIGDFLTSSDLAGRAIKATHSGFVLGKALEDWSIESGKDTVMVFIQPTFYFAELAFSDNGNINIRHDENSDRFVAIDSNGNVIDQNGAFGDLTAGNIKAGKVDSEKIFGTTVEGTFASFENLSTLSFNTQDFSVENNFSAPEISTDNIRIGNLMLGYKNEVLAFSPVTASESALLTLSKQGEASFSGKINSPNIETTNATIETLNVKNLVVENLITPAGTSSATLDFGAQGIKTDFAEFDFATIKEDLTVLGTATLQEAAIENKLTISNIMQIESNTINTIGSDLELQTLKQGNIVLMAGLVVIDTQGNMKVEGNTEFARDVKVGGVLSANTIVGQNSRLEVSGSARFDKIDFKVATSSAISQTEVINESSAGTVILSANQIELKVNNKSVTNNSLIYITPKTKTFGQTPYIKSQIKGESFTIAIELPVSEDIELNYLIVN